MKSSRFNVVRSGKERNGRLARAAPLDQHFPKQHFPKQHIGVFVMSVVSRILSAPRVLLTAWLLLGVTATLPVQAAESQRQLERIAALVDEDVVLESEVLERVRMIRDQMRSAGREAPPNDVLLSQVVERLILESIQLQMAQRGGIVVADDALTRAVQGIAEQNKMTLDQFIAQLAKDGMSYPSFREQVRREMVISRMQQARVMPRVFVGEQEVDNFLNNNLGKLITGDDYRVGHILLATPEGATPEATAAAEKKAQELYNQLKAGADFCALSVANSAAQNALDCGDLGWRKAPQLPALFAELVAASPAGTVLPAIRSAAGYHIVKVQDRRGATGQTEETKVRHILVRPSEIRTEEEAHQRALDVQRRLAAGEDFCALSAQFSEDPGSALICGELGWSKPEDFVPEFAAEMGRTAVKDRSAPFKSNFGWHILEVLDRRNRDVTDDNRKQLALRYIRSQRFDEELENFLAQIRADAYVDVKLGQRQTVTPEAQ